jgi:hypothetical protein
MAILMPVCIEIAVVLPNRRVDIAAEQLERAEPLKGRMPSFREQVRRTFVFGCFS